MPGGHKTTHLKTLFVRNYVHDKTSPSPGGMFVTVNLQVACVGTSSANGLKLQQHLFAGMMFSRVVFNVFAKNWGIRYKLEQALWKHHFGL